MTWSAFPGSQFLRMSLWYALCRRIAQRHKNPPRTMELNLSRRDGWERIPQVYLNCLVVRNMQNRGQKSISTRGGYTTLHYSDELISAFISNRTSLFRKCWNPVLFCIFCFTMGQYLYSDEVSDPQQLSSTLYTFGCVSVPQKRSSSAICGTRVTCWLPLLRPFNSYIQCSFKTVS